MSTHTLWIPTKRIKQITDDNGAVWTLEVNEAKNGVNFAVFFRPNEQAQSERNVNRGKRKNMEEAMKSAEDYVKLAGSFHKSG